jgi:hypothetical protein
MEEVYSSAYRETIIFIYITHRKACAGVNLVCGSHSRQRLRKSINIGSSQFFNACDQSLLAGGPRCFPRFERPK